MHEYPGATDPVGELGVIGRPGPLGKHDEQVKPGRNALHARLGQVLAQGSEHAEPAVLGVAVASVPSLLAVIGPLLEGSRPRPYLVAAALVVTGGAALVQGVGRTDAMGVVWAVVVFGCEAGFTLLGAPAPRPLVWVGIAVVAVGLALGLRGAPARARSR